MVEIADINPYQMGAGAETDGLLHRLLFKQAGASPAPPYSSDMNEAEKVIEKLRENYAMKAIRTGKTRFSKKPFFARHDSDPSTSTEVIAETLPLAICRLALLRLAREAAESA